MHVILINTVSYLHTCTNTYLCYLPIKYTWHKTFGFRGSKTNYLACFVIFPNKYRYIVFFSVVLDYLKNSQMNSNNI